MLVDHNAKLRAEVFRAETAKHAFYIQRAQEAIAQNDIELARQIIEDMNPLFKETWETRHLLGVCQRRLTILPHVAYCAAISADGQRIVSGDRNGIVKVWDALIGKELHTLMGHSNTVNSVAISADGRRIVSGTFDPSLGIGRDPGKPEPVQPDKTLKV